MLFLVKTGMNVRQVQSSLGASLASDQLRLIHKEVTFLKLAWLMISNLLFVAAVLASRCHTND